MSNKKQKMNPKYVFNRKDVKNMSQSLGFNAHNLDELDPEEMEMAYGFLQTGKIDHKALAEFAPDHIEI